MPAERKREWVFLTVVILIALFLLVKTVRFNFDGGPVSVTISQNDGALETLASPKKITSTQRIFVRKLAFPEGGMLENAQYGKLGYSQNFFIDAETVMQVAQAGDYRFEIRSDDGFSLKIDGTQVCAHTGNRPMRTTTCQHRFDAGRHLLELEYFQGGGPLGLEGTYSRVGEATKYIIGEASENVTFEKAGA